MTLQGAAFKKLNLSPEQLGVSTEDAKLLTEGVAEEEKPDEEALLADDGHEDDFEGEGEGEEAEEKPKPKKKRGPRKKSGDIEARLAGKFVNLVDIFPALPEKGKFDVSAIKESQYFFS